MYSEEVSRKPFPGCGAIDIDVVADEPDAMGDADLVFTRIACR